jgi:hypothetical protein
MKYNQMLLTPWQVNDSAAAKMFQIGGSALTNSELFSVAVGIAGHLMVIRKSTWTRVLPGILLSAAGKKILGVDTKISQAVLAAGLKILLMEDIHHWNNNEIRFSIRSVYQYLEGFGKIYIVGEKPDFLEGRIHIQHPDEFSPENADGNIIRKVLRACQDPSVSEKFLFMNDDHLFLKETRVAEIPPFHKGDMNSFPQHYYGMNPWRKRLYLNKLALEKYGLPTLHYDCHTPAIFEKKKFIDAMSRFDYASGIGLTMKSLYGNIYYPKAPLLAGEKRILFSFFKIQQLEAFRSPQLAVGSPPEGSG